MPFDSSSRILITGGTGSFGKAFIAETLMRFPEIKRRSAKAVLVSGEN
jgi:UDP-N-acetylglucosamine 4,6-dehydratase/5-epimerase